MDISFAALRSCNLCPRNCNANRFAGNQGWCKTDHQYHIASVVNHRGEEPAISGSNGICNIFFNHCNLQCIYCQNHQISDNNTTPEAWNFEKLLQNIMVHLNSGCQSLGFVSPSHQIPQMLSVIRALQHLKPKPIFVYNSNGYDKAEVLRELEGLIDVYLPDLKYASDQTAMNYSGANNYVDASQKALREMFRQKGAALHYNDDAYAESGLIVRHLVLPGHITESLQILRFIADELSPKVHVSLMAQYFPTSAASAHPNLNRTLTQHEYETVAREMETLGLSNGWLQDLESNRNYRPDFEKEEPFGI